MQAGDDVPVLSAQPFLIYNANLFRGKLHIYRDPAYIGILYLALFTN